MGVSLQCKVRVGLGLMLALSLSLSCLAQETLQVEPSWRLSIQAWSFNRYTFFEAVDKTAALGLKCIEAFPGQKLSQELQEALMGPDLSAELRQKVKDKLQSVGVKVVAFGVVGLPNDEAASRKIFDFAKDMGIEVLTSEPEPEALPLIDKLCQEYQIRVAIHNHPFPSRYWNPDTVLKACEGRSPMIGACADTGHWYRSKLVPVECLKKLEGRIVSLHFKDIQDGHDVVWGAGECNVKAMLDELHRQSFKGLFSIEYEYNWENSVPEISQCITSFKELSAKLGQNP